MPPSTTKKYVLGIDGGGTKTKACIAIANQDAKSMHLEILGLGQSGASNPRSVGFDSCFAELEKAILEARRNSHYHSQFDAACISLAGAGRREEQERLQLWANQIQIATRIHVADDVEPIAIAAEYESQTIYPTHADSRWEQSITLIAGTGSIACGKNSNGLRVRAGGWGYLLGDAGSGFSIGLAGMQAVCHAVDGTGPITRLSDMILGHLGLDSPNQLVGFIYRSPIPKDEVAKLAPMVVECAVTDTVAANIIHSQVRALSNLILAVSRRLGIEQHSYSLAMSGGLMSHHPFLVDSLLSILKLEGMQPLTHHVVVEPTYGSLMLAAQAANQ